MSAVFGSVAVGAVAPQALFANVPANAVPVGYQVFFTDWGANGTLARSNGTRWLPVNGQTVLKRMGAAVSGIAQTETIVAQVLLPINSVLSGDALGFRVSATKSGTTDSTQLSIRVGTTGTTADTALAGANLSTAMAGTSISTGFLAIARLLSATSIQLIGSGSGSSHYGAAATAAQAAATTGLTDMSTTAVWVSVSVRSNGATDTVAVQEATITHEAG